MGQVLIFGNPASDMLLTHLVYDFLSNWINTNLTLHVRSSSSVVTCEHIEVRIGATCYKSSLKPMGGEKQKDRSNNL
jgi:hypothetical protein